MIIIKFTNLKYFIFFIIVFVFSFECFAVGVCGLFKHEIESEGYSEKYKQIAVKESFKFCIANIEPIKGAERNDYSLKFYFEFINIFKINGKLKRRFLFKGDIKVLNRLKEYIDFVPGPFTAYLEDEILPEHYIISHLRDGGFIEKKGSLISPNNNCLIKLFTPIVDNNPVEYKRATAFYRSGKKDYYLATPSMKQFSGDLSVEAYWFDIKSKKRTPLVLLIFKQNKGWAPASPGMLFTREYFIINRDIQPLLKQCF